MLTAEQGIGNKAKLPTLREVLKVKSTGEKRTQTEEGLLGKNQSDYSMTKHNQWSCVGFAFLLQGEATE